MNAMCVAKSSFIILHVLDTLTLYRRIYSFLLCAPSFSIPSQPVILPATSSTLPKPDCWGSRFALACFMASMPAALSCSPDEPQDCAPVTLPMTPYT